MWYEGRRASNPSNILRTDGIKLYSYDRIIGFTDKLGKKITVQFRWKGYRHMSVYTKRHVLTLESFLKTSSMKYAFVYAADFETMFDSGGGALNA
jgi:hypothetical protein